MSDKSWEPGMYQCLNALNNFCFHVYAQNLLFVGENGNEFFLDLITRSCELRVHRDGSHLKKNV